MYNEKLLEVFSKEIDGLDEKKAIDKIINNGWEKILSIFIIDIDEEYYKDVYERYGLSIESVRKFSQFIEHELVLLENNISVKFSFEVKNDKLRKFVANCILNNFCIIDGHICDTRKLSTTKEFNLLNRIMYDKELLLLDEENIELLRLYKYSSNKEKQLLGDTLLLLNRSFAVGMKDKGCQNIQGYYELFYRYFNMKERESKLFLDKLGVNNSDGFLLNIGDGHILFNKLCVEDMYADAIVLSIDSEVVSDFVKGREKQFKKLLYRNQVELIFCLIKNSINIIDEESIAYLLYILFCIILSNDFVKVTEVNERTIVLSVM